MPRFAGFIIGLLLLSGCSSSASTDEEALPEPTAFAISTTTFDEGTITLVDGASTALQGVIAAPTSGGPHPVAVLVHGNHAICENDPAPYGSWPCPAGTEIRNDLGLTYLAESMARQGFRSLLVNVNVQYTWGAGEPVDGVRTAQLIDRSLEALRAGRFGIKSEDVSDVLVGVGHSRGGQDLHLMASGVVATTNTFDALVMLMPSGNIVLEGKPADIPSLVFLGTCDGDTGIEGGQFVAAALGQPRTSPTAIVLIEGGTHNAINTVLGADFATPENPECATPRTDTQQRDGFAEIIPLASRTLIGSPTSHWTGRIFTADVVLPKGMSVSAIDPAERLAQLKSSQAQGFATTTYCPLGYYTEFAAPGSGPCHRPELEGLVGRPESLALSWDSAGAKLTVPMSVQGGQTLRLRAFTDVADERMKSANVRLSVTVGGATYEVDLKSAEVVYEDIPPFRVAQGVVMWQTFDLVAGGATDVVVIEVSAPAQGSLQLVSASLLPLSQ